MTVQVAARPAAPPARYLAGPVLGAGSMGVVVRAQDRRLKREVAMKQLRQAEPSDRLVARFLREARITARLEHPCILPVHDLGVTEEGRVFFTQRLVRGGETLREVIDRLRAREPEAVERYS